MDTRHMMSPVQPLLRYVYWPGLEPLKCCLQQLFLYVTIETAVTAEARAEVAMANRTDHTSSPDDEKPAARYSRHRAAAPLGRRVQIGKRRGHVDKRRGQKDRRRGQEAQKEGVTVKRTWSDGRRRWDKKHYCVFCRRPQVKIARHLLRKHADQEEVAAASMLPTGSKQRHLLLEHLRCRGNYLHNIEVCSPVNSQSFTLEPELLFVKAVLAPNTTLPHQTGDRTLKVKISEQNLNAVKVNSRCKTG